MSTVLLQVEALKLGNALEKLRTLHSGSLKTHWVTTAGELQITARNRDVTLQLSVPYHGTASVDSLKFSPTLGKKVVMGINRAVRKGSCGLVTMRAEVPAGPETQFSFDLEFGDATYSLTADPWKCGQCPNTEDGNLLWSMPRRPLTSFLSRVAAIMPSPTKAKGGQAPQNLYCCNGFFFSLGGPVGGAFLPSGIQSALPHRFMLEKPFVKVLLDLLKKSSEPTVQAWTMPDSSIRVVVGREWANSRPLDPPGWPEAAEKRARSFMDDHAVLCHGIQRSDLLSALRMARTIATDKSSSIDLRQLDQALELFARNAREESVRVRVGANWGVPGFSPQRFFCRALADWCRQTIGPVLGVGYLKHDNNLTLVVRERDQAVFCEGIPSSASSQDAVPAWFRLRLPVGPI